MHAPAMAGACLFVMRGREAWTSHDLHTVEVTGSSPVPASIFIAKRGRMSDDRRKFLAVTDREFDTILAALRHYEEGLEDGSINPGIEDIAADKGAPLTVSEVDELGDRLNLSGVPEVVVARYEHRAGVDTRVFASEDAAEGWRQEIAGRWFEQELGRKPPEDPSEAADEYFETMRDQRDVEEAFETNVAKIESGLQPVEPAVSVEDEASPSP